MKLRKDGPIRYHGCRIWYDFLRMRGVPTNVLHALDEGLDATSLNNGHFGINACSELPKRITSVTLRVWINITEQFDKLFDTAQLQNLCFILLNH